MTTMLESPNFKAGIRPNSGIMLDSNQETLQGTVKEVPSREVIDVPVNEMLIVELYSK